MKHKRLCKLMSFASIAFLAFSNVQAQASFNIKVPTTVVAGEMFMVRVESVTNSPFSICGLHVKIDGIQESVKQFRLWHESVKLPLDIPYKAITPGTFTVRAEGGRVMSSLSCVGTDQKQIIVTPAAVAAPQKKNIDVEALRAKALRGDADAAVQVGNILANVNQDKEAFSWFKKAADQGHANGQYSVGLMYEEGRGVLQNHTQAHKWYDAAILKGQADALLNKGTLLLKGIGVPANQIAAYAHFSLAAARASDTETQTEAVKARNDLTNKLTVEDLSRAQVEADKLNQRIQPAK